MDLRKQSVFHFTLLPSRLAFSKHAQPLEYSTNDAPSFKLKTDSRLRFIHGVRMASSSA